MKRGLVVRDPQEIADLEWTSRVEALQADLASDGIDVALIYGDVFRPDDVGYLTNLCIYWNEGMIAVPAVGDPVLLTKLSARVHTWMRATSTLDDLRSGRTFGELVAAFLADREPGVIGFIEADLWPAAVLDEVSGAVPDWRSRLLGPVIRDRRAIPSAAELKLLDSAASVLTDGVAEALVAGLTVTERVASVERTLRRGGFADVFARTASAAGALTLDVTGEYRHNWIRMARVVGDAAWLPGLHAGLGAAIAALRPGIAWRNVEDAATASLTELPADSVWSVSWVSQADLATGGELRPLNADHAPRDGEVATISLTVVLPDGSRATVADTVLVTAAGPRSLTSPSLIAH
jgi:Xaa-Pro aminopeptidase